MRKLTSEVKGFGKIKLILKSKYSFDKCFTEFDSQWILIPFCMIVVPVKRKFVFFYQFVSKKSIFHNFNYKSQIILNLVLKYELDI